VADLPEALQSVILGPEDKLVIVLKGVHSPDELRATQQAIAAHGFGDRTLILGGAVELAVLRATKAEGSTVGQCGDMAPTLMFGEREIGSYLSCHLAFGHSGMHSDGEATWSNEGDQS